jgi:dihydroneopterin aldolase
MAQEPRKESTAGAREPLAGEVGSDAILLEGIQMAVAIGVTAVERRLRRPVRIDLEVGRDLEPAGRSDAIRHTLDYGDIYRVVEGVAGGREHKLVEALAHRIAEAILSGFLVDWVTVTVRKAKPIAGVLDWAGVRVTRRSERSERSAG